MGHKNEIERDLGYRKKWIWDMSNICLYENILTEFFGQKLGKLDKRAKK